MTRSILQSGIRCAIRALVSLLGAIALGSCGAAKRFPLCPELAMKSYPVPAPAEATVNKHIVERAAERRVQIHVLSPFAAELAGHRKQISWFDKHYRFMVCGFDPANVIPDEATYLTCMGNADRWVEIVRSEEAENLMLKDTHYVAVCVR